MPPPTGIRLRDSCQSCAASKTKCSKDKPQCARCAKRGTKCEYLVTQRTGRKALVRRDSDAKEQSSDAGSRRKSLSRSTTTATSTTTMTSSSSMCDAPDVHMSGCAEPPDEAADMYMIEPGLEAFDADTAGSMLPEMSTIHDDYFSLLLPDVDMSALDQVYDTSSAPDAVASDMLAQPPLGTSGSMPPHGTAAYASYTQGNDVAAAAGHSSPRDPLPLQQPDLGMLLDAACLPGAQPQTGEQTALLLSEMQMPPYQTAMHHAAASQQQQEGLTMALQLMQHLCCLSDSTSSSSNSISLAGPGAAGPQHHHPFRLRNLMDKCSKATATISAILHGDSSHDAYFLAVVCLAMSKVLDAYVTASRTIGTPTADYSRRKSRSPSASSSSPSVLSSPTRPDSARSNRSSGSVSPPVVLQGDPESAL
ncbi:hypothetical protein COCMIDRAFT_25491 [Bipolaris oryzae ATCC 44560]|uniref:Zn(2)-C6 fungal-type domain-containing protein n=1 Tax=Bipolaris oryzae ATCC 44560 TaxID=930090 RepID=W6ZGB1_COCMI|nr:uncharacterized protein COCMIDRAFT_25491 [Bipolaris oryzae ATCC 44560]EUC46539.1 hypothetical protein COCMIDRAFT_25491 [Bipolaris oryzae ATCC 44560]